MSIEARQSLVKENRYNIKCPYEMNAIGICVHNTANDASAENEVKYMTTNNNEVSFHFAIDDKEVVQGILTNRNAWHAGDGGNGQGNRKYIAIEICYSKSGGELFDKAEQLAAKFIAQILKANNWGVDKVKKHQDFSIKYCPHRTLDRGWTRFIAMIQTELITSAVNYLNLSASVERWRVYPLDKTPRIGNEVGFLAPSRFGGLSYRILNNPQVNVYTIRTQSFGNVNIYAPRDNDSSITTLPVY